MRIHKVAAAASLEGGGTQSRGACGPAPGASSSTSGAACGKPENAIKARVQYKTG